MRDPKFVELLAEHTFCLCCCNQGSPRASLGPRVPRGLAALSEQSEKDAVTACFPFGQGQLAKKKEQDIREPSKNLKLMYPLKTRDLHLSFHCHHLSQLLTNAVQPHPALTGYIYVSPGSTDGCLLSSIRDLSYPSLLFVLPVRNEIT